ncbi:hypothetical protein IAG25_32875 [Caballeronia sp. EK]|uniref:hypothetical protein n=1 Tax=Caballeronia sp. EK TaxID=2767469 RepID=UPI0016564CD8|nr:hypothetical protein [Caballeronia sp. EK]MBC8641620.1 hypothetical protein [Caballeronia sp. EK]
MDKVESGATEHLAHTLSKFTFVDLTQDERQAAFMVARTLPKDAVLKDFAAAASASEIERAGLPAEVASILAPLVARLEKVAYAARFAALFDASK